MKINVLYGRLAFPEFFTPKAVNDGDKEAYSGTCILVEGKTQLLIDGKRYTENLGDVLNKIADKIATEKWKDKAPAILKQLRAQDKIFLHDGDNKPDYDGYPGNLYISGRTPTKPKVLRKVDGFLRDVEAHEGLVYGGCYGEFIFDVYAQDNSYGKRLNASLKGFRFQEDGDAFGAGAPAKDSDFDLSADEEDEESLA